MNIALDYDGTYTADPELWLSFIRAAQERGHLVAVVTMRYPSECTPEHMDPRLLALGLPMLATSRKAKRPAWEVYAASNGLPPLHVWIDDNPGAVTTDAAELWPYETDPAPEGRPITPVYR